MPKKKDPLAPPGRRIRAYELPNLVNVQGSPDLARQMEDEALRDLSNEYRQLRVEEMISKKRRQLEKSASTSGASMPIRQIEDDALKDLSNEYRQLRVEEMIQKKKRQLEKSAPTSDISMQKQNLDLVTTIFRLAKDLQPQQGKDDTLAYVAMFKDLLIESVKIQNQGGRGPSFFESIITDPNLYQRTKDIFGSGKTGATNASDIEIEKLRGERMLDSKRIDLELHRMRLEAEDGREKIGIIAQVFAPALAYGAAKVENDMRKKGTEAGNKFFNPNNPAPHTGNPGLLQKEGIINPTPPQEETTELRVNCDCGHDEMVTIPVPPPESLACPGCGKMLIIGKVDEEREAQLK